MIYENKSGKGKKVQLFHVLTFIFECTLISVCITVCLNLCNFVFIYVYLCICLFAGYMQYLFDIYFMKWLFKR